MENAFNFFFSTFSSIAQNLNFSIVSGVGLLDFLIATALIAVVVHNFVHMAR